MQTMFGTKRQVGKSGPPARQPIYAEPLLGDDAFLEPEQALRLFSHQLKGQLEITGKWSVSQHELSCDEVVLRDQKLEARFLEEASRKTVDLKVTLAGNWINIEVSDGAIGHHFFAERVYEEWEVWPSGSSGKGEALGRIGKRMNWAQLELTGWPALAVLADNGLVTIEASD